MALPCEELPLFDCAEFAGEAEVVVWLRDASVTVAGSVGAGVGASVELEEVSWFQPIQNRALHIPPTAMFSGVPCALTSRSTNGFVSSRVGYPTLHSCHVAAVFTVLVVSITRV